ncbi:MAG: sulfatase, partial [Pseudonocardia sp.]|nr:sulfatase [Pseudonocardia sp.]
MAGTDPATGEPAERVWRAGRRHSVVARIVIGCAGLLVFVALVVPDRIGDLRPPALLRLPVEGLVGAALFVLLPARPRRAVAAAGGAGLGLLTMLKIVNMGFLVTLDRPFHPLTDAGLLDDGAQFLTDSIGRTGAIAALVGAVFVALGVLVLTTLATLLLSDLLAGRRRAVLGALAGLIPIWVICAVLGAQIMPSVPVAAAGTAGLAYREAAQARADLRARAAFEARLANPPADARAGGAQTTGKLAALRGKDVVLVFVESYGRDAIEDPQLAPPIDAVLNDGTRRLNTAGFASRSAFLTSPTLGAGSWLAHSTLLSGLWIDSQQRYQDLVTSDRPTLTRDFRAQGWRTVAVMPGTTSYWAEEPFYGYDQVYDAYHLGYRGPRYSFIATMPDQYALAAFERLEHAVPNRPPLMAQIVLVCSHAPFEPLPRPVGWDQIGDGSTFHPDVTGPTD